MLDSNELIDESSPVIAAVGQCQQAAVYNKNETRDKWLQSYVMSEAYDKYEDIFNVSRASRQSVPSFAHSQSKGTIIKEGEITAIESIAHKQGQFGLDSRPKVFDKSSKQWVLLDSGSVLTCTPKQPGDKIDHSFKLRAVNGGVIPTYGCEKVTLQINRKTYDILAVKADVPHKIFGWDLFKKYHLGFEWNETGDLFITDKKAQIKSLLKHVAVPAGSIPRIENVVESVESEYDSTPKSNYFQHCCMLSAGNKVSLTEIEQFSQVCEDNLPIPNDPVVTENLAKNLEALEQLSPTYQSLIKNFPGILEAKFKEKTDTELYHRIDTGEAEPHKCKVRPILASSEKSKEGKKIWSDMENLGIVERVSPKDITRWTNPLHLVRKPSGRGWRVCGDFRILNQKTKSDNYPLPILRSFTKNIKKAKIFSKLDLQSAFHHLPIHPDDVEKTCVLSPWGGAYVFKRLAFGLSNGPSSWQRYVDSIFGDIEGLFIYLDDILLCAEDEESHLSLLTTVLERIHKHGLTLALDKCELGRSEIDYLGYRVTSTGICPLSRKVEAITSIPPPKTQKELLGFLGALNYFRPSLGGLVINGKYNNTANILQPLYSAATIAIPNSKGKFEEIWSNSPMLQQSFVNAKKLLTQATELSHPDPNLPLALMTDASQHSVGAVLMQLEKNGKWVPLGHFSRHLSQDKIKWAIYRKEILACQAGLRYFIKEIYGRHFTIFSDHAPLVQAFKNQNYQLHDPVAQRALMEIGMFTKDIRHLAGKDNVGSDFFSRIAPEVKGTAYDELAALEGLKLYSISAKEIFKEQQNCAEIELLKNGKHAKSVTFADQTYAGQSLFCEMSMSIPRPFLPKNLRVKIMRSLHNLGHYSIKESVRKISMYYYWTNMKEEITKFCQTCHGCQSAKTGKFKPPNLGHFEVPDTRFSHIHLDIVGPLPESQGYKHLLTTVDRTTRLFSALPVKDTSAKTCAQAFLLYHVALYGVPSACTSDQGSNFVSEMFQEMQKDLGIEIKHSPIYWPQANGLIERNHQSLKNSLKAQLVEMAEKFQDKWMDYLPWVLLGRRTAFNRDLKTSSAELTFGMHPQIPMVLAQEVKEEEEDELTIDKILTKLRFKNERIAVPTSTNNEPFTKPPPQTVTHVYTRQHNVKGLQTNFRGPFEVISRPTRSTVKIKVGLNKDGSDRVEVRSWGDTKPAYLRAEAEAAVRPKRGRPSKPKEATDANDSTDSNVSSNQNNASSTNLATINVSQPPSPPNSNQATTSSTYADRMWTASINELEYINESINPTMKRRGP